MGPQRIWAETPGHQLVQVLVGVSLDHLDHPGKTITQLKHKARRR